MSSNPFDDKGNAKAADLLLDKMKGAMKDIDTFRELLETLRDVEESNEEQHACNCVLTELEQFDATLFGIHNTLHVYGLQVTRHLMALDAHEARQRAATELYHRVQRANEEFGPVVDKKDFN